jgi:ATP-dependent RNA helicase DeaD
VHRIGRTGRAGREGVAITLAESREFRLLRNLEFHTKRKITMENVPSVRQLRAKRLELTKTAVGEAFDAGALDEFRAVAQALAADRDPIEVLAAALKVADAARDGAATDSEEIPPMEVTPPDRPGRPMMPMAPRPFDGGQPRQAKPRAALVGVTRIFIGLGRRAGIRPADLVGAIANEAKLNSKDIGHIDIADQFSLVDVPDDAAQNVILALRGATIRGRKVIVRRDRDTA